MTSSPPPSEQALATVDAFLAAYNAKDFDAVGTMLADDIRLVHYGRGIDIRGHEQVVGALRSSAEGAFPDRRFTAPRRRLVDGEHVVVEQVWEATAAVDVPGVGAAGEAVRIDLCTVFAIRDGQISDYEEYG